MEQLGNYKIPDHLGFSLTPGIKCLGSEGHSIGSTNRCIVSFRFLNSIDPVIFSLYQVYMLLTRLCLYTRWWHWSDFGREQSPYTSRRSVSGPEGNLALFSWKREVKNAAKLPACRGLFSLFGTWGGPLSAWKQQRDFLVWSLNVGCNVLIIPVASELWCTQRKLFMLKMLNDLDTLLYLLFKKNWWSRKIIFSIAPLHLD